MKTGEVVGIAIFGFLVLGIVAASGVFITSLVFFVGRLWQLREGS